MSEIKCCMGKRPRLSKAQYQKALRSLVDAMGQLKPDGMGCAVCGDCDHQAWECGHNPLAAMVAAESAVSQLSIAHDALHGACDDLPHPDALDRLKSAIETVHETLHDLIGCNHTGGLTFIAPSTEGD